MPTVHFVITGRVQGVGFRRFVQHHANVLGITGFVANLDDGSVECVAQGATDALTDLELLLRQGPQHSRVDGVSCTDLDSEPRRYSSFRIV